MKYADHPHDGGYRQELGGILRSDEFSIGYDVGATDPPSGIAERASWTVRNVRCGTDVGE
jgi:hypothetical protein